MALREGSVVQDTSAWLSGSHDLRQPTSLGMCVAQSTVSKAASPECGGCVLSSCLAEVWEAKRSLRFHWGVVYMALFFKVLP